MRIDFERFFALFKVRFGQGAEATQSNSTAIATPQSMGTRRELYFIMHKYTDKTETLSSKGIHAFLEIEQMVCLWGC
jgi:hypothetical protein